MAAKQSTELANRAKAIYDEKLKHRLESSNLDDFVAVEPDSGEFFLGKTLSEAIQAARARTRTVCRSCFAWGTRRLWNWGYSANER